jgi:hypothetical protein
MCMPKIAIIYATCTSDNGMTYSCISMPSWYINFYNEVPFNQIDNVLCELYAYKYHTQLYVERRGLIDTHYIHFDTNEDYIEFVLKWA